MGAHRVYVGIDVAKATLDVAVSPTAERWSLAHTEREVAGLVSRLTALVPALVVLEATGGLEGPLVGALAAAGLPVVVVNPRQVRDFAKATGLLAKTDALDAAVLAHFAAAVRPTPRPLPDAATQTLAALVTRRRQLVEMLTAERNRLAQAPGPSGRRSRRTSPGCSAAWAASTPTSARPSARAPSGASRTTSCRACPGWGRCWRGPCSPACRSSGP